MTRCIGCGLSDDDPLPGAGQGEGFKAAVHLGLFALSVACLGYNALAWTSRRERHLLRNAIAYAGLTTFEITQLKRHWSTR